jgi:hypothetical protein
MRLTDQLRQPEMAQARPELREGDLVVVTDERGREHVESFASAVVIQKAGEVSARIGVRATPFAIAVSRAGVVAVGLPDSPADIADLALKCRPQDRTLDTAPA